MLKSSRVLVKHAQADFPCSRALPFVSSHRTLQSFAEARNLLRAVQFPHALIPMLSAYFHFPNRSIPFPPIICPSPKCGAEVGGDEHDNTYSTDTDLRR